GVRRRERFFSDPSPDGRRQIGNRPWRVVVLTPCPRDPPENFDQGVAPRLIARAERAVALQRPEGTLEKVDEGRDLLGGLPRRRHRRKLASNRQRRVKGLGGT